MTCLSDLYVDCWHFSDSTLRDGSPLPYAGENLPELSGVVPCERGMYHGSVLAIDALKYAPGPFVARVRLSQRMTPHGSPVDKYAAQRRMTLTDYVDVSEQLSEFARLCVRQCAHLWNPEPVVLAWLGTGDPSLLARAGESASASASYSARAIAIASYITRAIAIASARASAIASAIASASYSASAIAIASAIASASAITRASASALQNIALELRLCEALGILQENPA